MRPAVPADRACVVATVAAAFVDDPAFRYFFAEPSSFAAEAGAFAGWLFDRRIGQGGVWLVDDAAAVAMWDPPGGGDDGGSGPPDLPPATLARLRTYDGAVTPLLPREPHWYLGVLATRPDRAGERLGRLAMAPGLEAAAAAGLPAALEAVTDRNVRLYERSGWSVVGTVSVGPLTVRVMAHPPNSVDDLATPSVAG